MEATIRHLTHAIQELESLRELAKDEMLRPTLDGERVEMFRVQAETIQEQCERHYEVLHNALGLG
jgi:hypothetical protein